MAQGNKGERRQWRMKQACFEEGSQTADTLYPLFGLSQRCIPSWVSRAHPSLARGMQHPQRGRAAGGCPTLPLRRIYHFIDSLNGGLRTQTAVRSSSEYLRFA